MNKQQKQSSSKIKKLFNFFSGSVLFLLVVTVLIYIQFFLKDRYVSTSQFTVEVDETNNTDVISGITSIIGGGSTGDTDSQSVISFVHSADLLLRLEKEFDLQNHFDQADNDILFRLAAPASLEDRLEYYRNRITATYELASNHIELQVQSFNPELSRKLSFSILKQTEEFVNQKNKKIAEDKLQVVVKELERSHSLITDAEKALLEFQNKHKIIQPEAIIQAQLAAIQSLRLKKIEHSIELTTIRASSPNSPMIESLEVTIKELESAILKQEAELSGPEQAKLNQLLAEYKELSLNLEFAIKLRSGAELLLEDTRSETIANSRFFSLIQNPILPEEAIYPERHYWSIIACILIFLSFVILNAIRKSIFDRT